VDAGKREGRSGWSPDEGGSWGELVILSRRGGKDWLEEGKMRGGKGGEKSGWGGGGRGKGTGDNVFRMAQVARERFRGPEEWERY